MSQAKQRNSTQRKTLRVFRFSINRPNNNVLILSLLFAFLFLWLPFHSFFFVATSTPHVNSNSIADDEDHRTILLDSPFTPPSHRPPSSGHRPQSPAPSPLATPPDSRSWWWRRPPVEPHFPRFLSRSSLRRSPIFLPPLHRRPWLRSHRF